MIKETQIEVRGAIGQAFDYCIDNCPSAFMLFLARPEFEKNWFNTNKSMVLMESNIDGFKDASREEFYLRYLRRNYHKEGFAYDGQAGVDDLHIELMIYTHIWESNYFYKQLYRLTHLIMDGEYVWDVNTEDSKFQTIRQEIAPSLKEQHLLLGEILENAYSSYLRDSFAHSEYVIDEDKKLIYLFNQSRNNKDKGSNTISFEKFQKKFMQSVQLCYWLKGLIEQVRDDFAEKGYVSDLVPIPDGRMMKVVAKMVGEGEYKRARFEGFLTCDPIMPKNAQ